ncbi:MAG TPA: FIST N-terminal domain-containing protein [Actinomycetota bacterium]|nr:FIST N-terminal domain-containing protein [Actinomycetota bacterium]
MTGRLVVATGLSTDPDGVAAAAEAAATAARGLSGAPCDLAAIFVSAAHADAAVEIAAAVHVALEPGAMIGATGGTVAEGGREIEDRPAVAVWAAHLPDTEVEPFSLEFTETPDGPTFLGWPSPPAGAAVIMLADPFTVPVDRLLDTVNTEQPGLTVVGGLASGAGAPGGHRIWQGSEVANGGAAGVVIRGRVKVRTLVSQGCRPIGTPATVTNAQRNVIVELAGLPPVERLRDLWIEASPDERALIQRGLHIGRVVDEYKTEFERGDFLIRNVMGADETTGAMAVGDLVGVGETVQFHVRDAATADEDLRAAAAAVPPPAGAMLFTCNGRGSHLFGAPDHDAGVLSSVWRAPLAGMSCAGEIGPVGGRVFLHGFTASLALFYDEQA